MNSALTVVVSIFTSLAAAGLVVAQEPVIFQPPVNTSVCINSTARFFAIHNGTNSDWFIDGVPAISVGTIRENVKVQGTEDLVNSTLSFLVTSAESIQVVIAATVSVSPGVSVASDPVTVHVAVQGPPSPPSNLTATPLNEASIKLTWSVPPGVLDEELISYLVEVRNESGGLIVLSETLTGKEYIFSVENPNPCDLYSFTVTPLCGTVEGETSAVKNGTFLAVSTVRAVEDRIIKAKNIDQVSFVVLFDIMFLDEETLCPGRMGQRVIVNIQGALVITITVSSLEAVMSDNTTSRQLNISDYEFPDNQFLTASITLQNGVVTSNKIELEFSTFDVSSASASFSGGLACDFIEGSDARGCFFILISDRHLVHYAVLQRNGSSPVAMGSVGGVEGGEYVGFVYDIESSGVPSLMPATIDNLTLSVTQDPSVAPTDFPPDLISRDGLGVSVGCPVDTGCVVISQVEGSVEISVEETEAGSTKTFPLEPGRHRVAVFEREQDGVIGGQPLDVDLVQVTAPSTSTAFPSPTATPTATPTGGGGCPGCIAGTVVGVILFLVVAAIASFSIYLLLMWWSGRDTFACKGRQRKKTRVDAENVSLTITTIKMTSPTNLEAAETSIGDSTKAGVSRGSALQKEVDMRDVGLYDKVSHNQQAQQQQQHQQPHKEPDIQNMGVYSEIVDGMTVDVKPAPSVEGVETRKEPPQSKPQDIPEFEILYDQGINKSTGVFEAQPSEVEGERHYDVIGEVPSGPAKPPRDPPKSNYADLDPFPKNMPIVPPPVEQEPVQYSKIDHNKTRKLNTKTDQLPPPRPPKGNTTHTDSPLAYRQTSDNNNRPETMAATKQEVVPPRPPKSSDVPQNPMPLPPRSNAVHDQQTCDEDFLVLSLSNTNVYTVSSQALERKE